jgi:GNAT superfamily N-acetyltransferase
MSTANDNSPLTFVTSVIKAEETKPLRHQVLWPHKATIEECFIDIDIRPDAIHLGTWHNGRLVSIGSLFEMKSPKLEIDKQYRLRAMATHPDYQGKNAGKVLLEKAFEILREKEIEVLWCDAREKAIGFYTALGFHLLDEIYEVPCIGPHKFMWKVL